MAPKNLHLRRVCSQAPKVVPKKKHVERSLTPFDVWLIVQGAFLGGIKRKLPDVYDLMDVDGKRAQHAILHTCMIQQAVQHAILHACMHSAILHVPPLSLSLKC